MDATTIILIALVTWLLSGLAVIFWAAYREYSIEHQQVAIYAALGPLCFPIIGLSYLHYRVWPHVRRFYRRERAYIVSKLEDIKWRRLGGK